MFSDSNDTLDTTPSAETLVDNVQAEGAEGSDSTQSTSTPTGAPGEKLYAGKYRTVEDMERGYQELQKMNSRKANPAETAKALGLTETPAQQPITTQAQARQVAQQVGGDELEQWFTKAAAQAGTAAAITALINHYVPQQLSQYLAPVNDQLVTAKQRENQQSLRLASERILSEFGDVDGEGLKRYWETNPKKMAELMNPNTNEDDKFDILESAVLKVSRTRSTNSTAAAKTAGAVDAKRQEAMKATTVTGGAGARGNSAPDAGNNRAKEFAEAARRMNQSSDLF